MAARRASAKVTTIDQSKIAMTSSSGVVLGLGFMHNIHTVEQVIELLQSGSITGTIFIGVLLEGSSGAPGLKAYEGTEETTAKSKSGRSRTRRGQR